MNKIFLLHLEDDPNDSELVLTELSRANIEIDYTRVDTEQSFIEKLGQQNFDIILADYKLPGFDGISALKICVAKYPEIPFIFVSGTLGEENAVKTLQNGASDYLVKQNLNRLVPAIERALTEAATKREKIRMEQELIASEAKFRSIIENSADAIFIADSNGRYVFVNKAATQLLGYSEAELLAKTIEDLAPDEEHVEKIKNSFNQLLTSGKVTAEMNLLKKDKTIVPIDLNGIILPGGLFYGSCRDITDRKKAELALRKSEAKYRGIFDNVQDVFYQSDMDGIITEISPSIERLSGFSRQELLGQYTTVFYFHREERKAFIEKLARDGEVWDYEIQLKTKDNGFKYTSLNAHFIFNSNCERIGIEGTLRNIDERKHFEIKLEEAKLKAEESDRLKTIFLQNISHEVRTPMNAIIGFSSLLAPNLGAANLEQYVQIIKKSSHQLLAIISDIVDMSSIEARVIKTTKAPVNIHLVIDSLYEQFKKQVLESKKNIVINVHKESLPNHFFAVTDTAKLTKVLNNLLSNALKYTLNGKIEFGCKLAGNDIEFFVSDTGIGIPEDHHARIFDNFYQVENELALQYGGTGLGLAITKAYVHALGGKIGLNSESGKGSVFSFTLPYVPVKNEITLQSNSNGEKLNKSPKILVAEDDDSNYYLIDKMLTDHGITTLRAINGKEAVENCLSDNEIALVLMDLKMPIMDGYTATEQIKAFRSNLPVIAQTAFVTDNQKAMNSGCDDLIGKPYNAEALIGIIQKYLHKKQE